MRKGREERMSYVESRQCARVLSPGLLSHHHKCEGVCLRLRPGPSGLQKYIQLVLPIGVQLEVQEVGSTNHPLHWQVTGAGTMSRFPGFWNPWQPINKEFS